MTDKIFNRPHIDGKPVEGPLPFTDLITPVDAGVLGGIAPDYWEETRLTSEQLASFAAFRENYPIYYDTEDGGVTYPPGALEFSDEQLRLAREQIEQNRSIRQQKLGSRIISRLIPGTRRK